MVALPLCASVSPLQTQAGVSGSLWEPAGVTQGECGFSKMETLAVPLEMRVVAWLSAHSQDCSPQGREATGSLGVPMSEHSVHSATCRTKPATVATSSADLHQPSEEQSLSARLDNALIKRRQ